MLPKNQFQLMMMRRFAPFFSVQFLGALNDNVFKTAVLILISMTFAKQAPDKANFLNNLGAALFIFPFFLFSATAGQLADKYNKRRLVRIIKFAEILIALLIGLGFYLGNFSFLLTVLFLLGAQSAFFSPVKYSILPQYLTQKELMGGNGLIEMGTFVAILVGTIIGGLFISHETAGKIMISFIVLGISIAGWLVSLMIPPPLQDTQDRYLKINWEPFSQTVNTLKEAYLNSALFWTMIGISWFWFYGSMIITQIPNYTRLFVGGDAKVMTLLLFIGSLGIGFGSLLCEPFSRTKLRAHLITFGAIGLSIFAIDLSFANPKHWHVLVDIFLIGLSGGFFSVPLYVILQIKSIPEKRSQIIAANNILNAIFMTGASFVAIGLLIGGLNIPQLFLVVGIINAMMTLWVFVKIPKSTIE